MTHDHVIEKLPWLLNGSLAAGERREVEEHLAGCAECQAELELTREAFQLYSAHLPSRLLVVYAETPPGDRLTIDGETVDRRSVDAHLAHCEDCREELEMVRDSRAALGAEEVASAEGEADVVPFARRRQESAPPRAAWMPMALAASLLLAAVLAGGWWFDSRDGGAGDLRASRVEELESQLDEARRQLAAARAADPAAAGAGAAAERVRELEAEVAGLSAAANVLSEQVADLEAELSAPLENVAYAVPTPLDGDAVRGGDGLPGGRLETVTAGPVTLLAMIPEPSRLEGASEVGYRVLGPRGGELYSGRLELFPASGLASAYFGLGLRTAELPAGKIEVVLTDAGREVGRFAFRVGGE